MFLSQIYPFTPHSLTLAQVSVTGRSLTSLQSLFITSTRYQEFQGVPRSAQGPACAWGHMNSQTQRQVTLVLPLLPSHNPSKLGNGSTDIKKLPGTPTLPAKIFGLCHLKSLTHTHILWGDQNCAGETIRSIFLQSMHSIPPIHIYQHWLPIALATPQCHHSSSNSLSGTAI